MPDPKVKPMTATERKEIRRIISARFELLESDLMTRRAAIKDRIEKELTTSKAAQVTDFEAQLKALTAEAQKFIDKADALEQEMRQAGVTAKTGRSYRGNQWSLAGDIVTINIAKSVEVADLNQIVTDATKELLLEHGAAKLDLNKMQLQIEEELALGALLSDDAQNFLSRIPQASDLLPPADDIDIPQIEAGV